MSIPQTSSQPIKSTAPGEDEIRSALDAILTSPAFLRSERQSQFLRFVCDTALKGESAKLNEYVIAHEVFGRGTGYSPGEDSVVRRQAHSLRQKLHDYYIRDGAGSQVRIDIPSGRYVPVFVRADSEPASHAPGPEFLPLSETPSPPKPIRSRTVASAYPALAVLAAIFLVSLGYWAGLRFPSDRPIDPAVSEIWSPWLSDSSGAVLCLSNPLTAVVKQFPFVLPVEPHRNPPRIVVTPEQSDSFRQFFELPPGGHFYLYPALSQSKTGEALGTATLTAMLTRAGLPVHATQSRFLNWDSFRNQNLILLGHDEANRWLDPILNHLPIRMVTTDADKDRHIAVSGLPGATPKEFYLEFPADTPGVSKDYALVSMLAGVDDRHQLLLINGLNTEGTQIAMEYLCDPKRLRELLAKLRQSAPGHKGAWHFQFVLRTEVRDQVPTTADLLVAKVL
jgi:hypothetical protein